MYAQWNLLPLEHLGALRARGRDVVSFLQGQLSADLMQLCAERSLLAGYHNPQGRVLALLRLIESAPGEVLAILPRELVEPVASRLGAFILRSKVELADESHAWRIAGLLGPSIAESPATAAPGVAPLAPPFALVLPGTVRGVARLGRSFALRVGERPARWLIVSPAGASAGDAGLGRCAPAAPELWRRVAVETGEPQVYAATSGEFVAQMLNLDVLGAIAFDKGCYTGQEVIARAHYRGRVKRRLQRFRTDEPRPLQPGDAGELADGRAFRVVDAVRLPEGGCEFLAVTALATAEPRAADTPAPASAPRLRAMELPLPYALPE
jgi:folate-binding protein YgfZ